MRLIAPSLNKYLEKHIQSKKGVKWYIILRVKYTKVLNNGDIIEDFPYLRSKTQTSLMSHQLPSLIDVCTAQISKAMEEYEGRGSGWIIERITLLQVNIVKYRPLEGGTFIETPAEVKQDRKCMTLS